MTTIISLVGALIALVFLAVNVACATYTVKVDDRKAVFYGIKSIFWYRKNCGTKKTKYRLTAIRF